MSEDAGPTKRKAWTYAQDKAPSLADFFAGGERRRTFWHYWVKGGSKHAIDITAFFALKLLPASICSGLGARLASHLLLDKPTKTAARVRANLKRLHPDWSDADIDRQVIAFAASHGRQMTEYSIVQRLARHSRRLRFEGTDHLAERCRQGPVILFGAHISNWEVLWQALIDLGIPMSVNYDPPKERGRHWIVKHVRRRGGLDLLPPGKSAVRPALRLLENGGNLLVFCDEGFEGRVRAPFFGCKPHLESNYALVARLARKTNALIIPVYITRQAEVNFTIHALAPFHLPHTPDHPGRLLEDVVTLNAVMEPIVKDNAAEWYFINNTIPDP